MSYNLLTVLKKLSLPPALLFLSLFLQVFCQTNVFLSSSNHKKILYTSLMPIERRPEGPNIHHITGGFVIRDEIPQAIADHVGSARYQPTDKIVFLSAATQKGLNQVRQDLHGTEQPFKTAGEPIVHIGPPIIRAQEEQTIPIKGIIFSQNERSA